MPFEIKFVWVNSISTAGTLEMSKLAQRMVNYPKYPEKVVSYSFFHLKLCFFVVVAAYLRCFQKLELKFTRPRQRS